MEQWKNRILVADPKRLGPKLGLVSFGFVRVLVGEKMYGKRRLGI